MELGIEVLSEGFPAVGNTDPYSISCIGLVAHLSEVLTNQREEAKAAKGDGEKSWR